MLKIENVDIYGFESAIRGMRNPMNSWEKSDSDCSTIVSENGKIIPDFIGENDLYLMRKLCNAGTEHHKFLRMITVTLDVTAPLYWWKECDTYKVGTVRNSCSTMHKIHSKEFTLDDFSCDHLREASKNVLLKTIEALNGERDVYIGKGWPELKGNKECWYSMIQLLPSSYNQRATLMMNYEVLAQIYKQRKIQKLDEWHIFRDWIKTLPYSELITGEK